MIASAHGYISFAATRWIVDIGAALIHVDTDGKLLTVAGHFPGDRPSLRRAQAAAGTSPVGLHIARTLVGQRIRSQADVAATQLGDDELAERLHSLSGDSARAATIDRLRIVEAAAAGHYWKAWESVPVTFTGSGSRTRVPEHWRTFGSRHSPLTGSPRVAITPAGALQNYLLALLQGEARLACLAVGLDSGLGLLHTDVPWRDSLALDVVEAGGRAAVETWLLRFLRSQTFRLHDFVETRRGEVRLTVPLTSWLATTMDAWRAYVAPVATWVASMLADEPIAVRSPVRGFQRSLARLPSLPSRCRGCFRFLNGGSWCSTCEPSRTCRRCETSLSGMYANAVYCSERCRNAAAYVERRGDPPADRRCETCGTSLEGRRRQARHCSDACRSAARRTRKRVAHS